MQHQILGFFIDEWASIIAILGAFVGGLSWVMKKTLYPLQSAIEDLNTTMKRIEKDNETVQKRLEKHLIQSKETETRVKILEKEVFDK